MRNREPDRTGFSYEAYLRFEDAAREKHEWVGGAIYAMTGGTLPHADISGNIYARLREKCRGTPCHAWNSEAMVRPAEDVIYYPDASMSCEPQARGGRVIDRPCLVAEVTSRSTRHVDHGEKAVNYRRSPTLQAYLIVDQRHRHVTWHHRDAAGAWVIEELHVIGSIDLPCLGPGAQLTLDEIYEGVELPPLGVAEPQSDESDAYVAEP